MPTKDQNQEDFNAVWNHFIVGDGKPSLNPNGIGCAYRALDGSKCAVGLLMPDDVYDPSIEGAGVYGLYNGNVGVRRVNISQEMRRWLSRHDKELLAAMQSAHDSAADLQYGGFRRRLELRLRSIATEFDLTIPAAE